MSVTAACTRLTLPGFDLAMTLGCGQCFRWAAQPDGSFLGVAGANAARLTQRGDTLYIESDAGNAFWRQYFDCDRDYPAMLARLRRHPAMLGPCDYAGGIRLLRQDGWEALASFIISQNNNIQRIGGIIERLCALLGQPLGDGLYAFPAAEQLAGLTVEDLAPLRCGFRARYLIDAAQRVQSGEVSLARAAALPVADARAELMRITGVGVKVADCALLFGLHRIECLPVDVWVRRALDAYFPQGFAPDLADCAGFAQQLLFHYVRTCPQAAQDANAAAASGCAKDGEAPPAKNPASRAAKNDAAL